MGPKSNLEWTLHMLGGALVKSNLVRNIHAYAVVYSLLLLRCKNFKVN